MKLLFRKISEDDLAMILAWRTMPEVSDYMYTDPAQDIEKQHEWFQQISADPDRLDWVINVDEEDVGLVSIVRIDRHNQRCEWAYYLASPFVHGKGIGKSVELNILRYVFETLGLNKLCCEVFTANDRVIKLHEKFGSHIEGTRLEHIFKKGEFRDIVIMGILRKEWEEHIRDKIQYVEAVIE
ncbi:UDP-4-amino-4,6-dideoxy-N-acetyl-beta-L-altrosamine N-acetyltransferase [Candidatus Zixiibacteriota bacterium]